MKKALVSTVSQVNRGSTLALRRSTLDFCLGGQRSLTAVEQQREWYKTLRHTGGVDEGFDQKSGRNVQHKTDGCAKPAVVVIWALKTPKGASLRGLPHNLGALRAQIPTDVRRGGLQRGSGAARPGAGLVTCSSSLSRALSLSPSLHLSLSLLRRGSGAARPGAGGR